MKKTMIVLIALLACVAFVTPVFAQDNPGYVSEAADSSEMLWVKYTGDDGPANITVTTTTLVLDDGDMTDRTLTFADDAYTLADVVAWIGAVTNDSEVQVFQAKNRAGIGTDVVTNSYVIAAAATVLPKNAWKKHVKWDTTAVEHFDVVPTALLYDRQYGNGFIIDRIVGEPGGTGDLTVGIYESDTLVWQNTFASPVYVKALVNATNTAVNTLTLDIDVGIPTYEGKVYLIRATRATAGTTGILGVITK